MDLYHAVVTEDVKDGGCFVFYNVLPVRTHSDPDISLTDFALAYGAVHSDPNDSSASDLGSDGDIDGSDLARFVAQI